MNGMAAGMPEDDHVTFDDHLESKICHVDAETKQEGDDEEVDDRENNDKMNEYILTMTDEENKTGDVTVPDVDPKSEEPIETAGKEVDCSILKIHEADANPIVSGIYRLARDDIKEIVNDPTDMFNGPFSSDGVVEGSIRDQGGGIYNVIFQLVLIA